MGGYDGSHHTNKLYTLRKEKWIEEYPPMNTARSWPAVISTSDGTHLIVIGGLECGDYGSTVEIFQVNTRQWCSKVINLPHPLPRPSATICGDKLHVVGFTDKGYSCSLQASDDDQITLHSWTSLPPIPVAGSTAATVCGQLVIIGGRITGKPVNSIYQLIDRHWVEIGSMSSNRCGCLVINESPKKLIILGGEGAEDSVEECVMSTA